MSAPHWTVSAMCDVVVRHGSAELLADVAESVPALHLDEFFAQLGAVSKQLVSLGHYALSGQVVDLLVKLRSGR